MGTAPGPDQHGPRVRDWLAKALPTRHLGRPAQILVNLIGAVGEGFFAQASLQFYLRTHSLVGVAFLVEQTAFVIAGAASPTVRTLRRLLQVTGHDLELSDTSEKAARQNSPIAGSLREHRAEIKAAAERVGARNVRVFGSVARGEETPESDVDLLVDFPARERGLLPLLTLARHVEQIVGRRVDVAAVEVMAEPVRDRALAEAVPL